LVTALYARISIQVRSASATLVCKFKQSVLFRFATISFQRALNSEVEIEKVAVNIMVTQIKALSVDGLLHRFD